MQFTRYWLEDDPELGRQAGFIFDFGETSPEGFEAKVERGKSEGFGVIEGEYSDLRFRVDLKTRQPVPHTPPVVTTIEKIKTEAARRIQHPDAYPMWRQMNIMRDGTDEERETMNAYINAIREASDGLELELPEDYRDDRHWPGQPE